MLNKIASGFASVSSQGSILGPLLHNSFMNSISYLPLSFKYMCLAMHILTCILSKLCTCIRMHVHNIHVYAFSVYL